MTIVRRCVPVIAACFVIGVSAAGPTAFPRATPASVGLAAAPLGEATTLLTQFVAEKKIAGAVAAVARHGKLAYLESVGVQDLGTRAPMTERSLFRIYSMTKPVTAAAVMMLLEEGRFHLDDPVSKYLPEFKDAKVASPDGATRPPSREITVQDLLLHTSGLSHRTSELYRTGESVCAHRHAASSSRRSRQPGRWKILARASATARAPWCWGVVELARARCSTCSDEWILRARAMTETSSRVGPDQRALGS